MVCRLFDAKSHADITKWKHFPRYWPFVRGIHRSPVCSPHKGQWRGALMFSLICAWINGWVNNREAGDLRRHRAHYDVTVMIRTFFIQNNEFENIVHKTNTMFFLKSQRDKKLAYLTAYVFMAQTFHDTPHSECFVSRSLYTISPGQPDGMEENEWAATVIRFSYSGMWTKHVIYYIVHHVE